MGRPRLRRGCSLEVIFEEEDSTSAEESDRIAQQKAVLEERRQRRARRRERAARNLEPHRRNSRRRARSLDAFLDKKEEAEEGALSEGDESYEDIDWDPQRVPYVSRRTILQLHSFEDLELILDPSPQRPETSPVQLPAKSCQCCPAMPVAMETILEDQQQRRTPSTYAAFAAISQGSLTRKYRQIFEGGSVDAATNERSDILQAIRDRRNAKRSLSSPPNPMVNETIVIVDKKADDGVTLRCDKCSSIIRTPPSSPTILDPTQTKHADQDADKPLETDANEPEGQHKKLSNQPSNREVVEEELPKPDTVKNARSVFESNIGTYATLRPANRISHVKSNPSSKILRSESSDSKSHQALDSFLRGRQGQSAGKSKPTEELFLADDKLYVMAVGGVSAMRWPTRKDPPLRSPSPPVLQKRSFHRSSPSLCTGRLSRRSTDAESIVSEVSDWSSDWESDASFSSGRDSLFDKEVEGRYVDPEVLRTIRSYGMTLTYVNGRMIDENGVEVEKPTPPKLNKRSPPPTMAKPKMNKTTGVVKTTPTKEVKPRIISCVPKQSKEHRSRHSSGESSASSGVSSGRSDAESGSDDNLSSPKENVSPFASLKRTVSSKLKDFDDENRPPSPGPGSLPGAKSLGSSRFGSYSVVYDFRHSGDGLRV